MLPIRYGEPILPLAASAGSTMPRAAFRRCKFPPLNCCAGVIPLPMPSQREGASSALRTFTDGPLPGPGIISLVVGLAVAEYVVGVTPTSSGSDHPPQYLKRPWSGALSASKFAP